MDKYQNQNITVSAAPTGPTFYSMLQEIIDRFRRKDTRADIGNAINTEATQKHLIALVPDLNFERVTEDFWIDYEAGLRGGKHSDGKNKCSGRTIKNDLGIIKKVMQKAIERGLTQNDQFENFKVDTEVSDAVALTTAEIAQIMKVDFDLSNSTEKRLSECRDLFVVACNTGLRWSDFSNISKDRVVKTIKGYVFKISTVKTGIPVTVPANRSVLDIFKRYPNSPTHLPQLFDTETPDPKEEATVKRQFNKDIKIVCQRAELNEIARLHTNPTKPLWECVSSHTGRRSFCTNLYINKEKNKMTMANIMSFTGHRTESSFFSYIKYNDAEDAYRQTFEKG
jgi:integrase